MGMIFLLYLNLLLTKVNTMTINSVICCELRFYFVIDTKYFNCLFVEGLIFVKYEKNNQCCFHNKMNVISHLFPFFFIIYN